MALSPVRLRASMSVGSADAIAFTRSNSPALIASIKAAVSGMGRFYRAAVPNGRPAAAVRRSFSEGGRIAKAERRGLLAFLCFCAEIPAQAQAPDASQARTPPSPTLTSDEPH